MTGPHDISAIKAKLRKKLRFRRRHFAANLDAMAALAAFRALPEPLEHLLSRGAPVVAGYAATGGEPDILPLLADASFEGRLAMPFHALRDAHMDFRPWRIGDPLETGPWRVPQPLNGAQMAIPSILLCPMLGFDRRGGRLGQGGGHYDRYFARDPSALRIGVAWSVQEVDETPSEVTDLPLDAILTEQELIICGERFYDPR